MGVTRDQFSQGGYPTGSSAAFDPGEFFGISPGTSLGTATGVGPLGGFTAGWNWQAPGTPWVVGIEGEFMFSDLRGSTSNGESDAFGFFFPTSPFSGVSAFGTASFDEQLSSQVRDIATITGRLGIAAGPGGQTLWYIKGGGAWASDRYSASDVLATYDFEGLETRFGWTAGAGIEWAFSDIWSVRLEYDYYGFGTRSVNFIDNVSATVGPLDIKQDIQVIKIGVNFHPYPSGALWRW